MLHLFSLPDPDHGVGCVTPDGGCNSMSLDPSWLQELLAHKLLDLMGSVQDAALSAFIKQHAFDVLCSQSQCNTGELREGMPMTWLPQHRDRHELKLFRETKNAVVHQDNTGTPLQSIPFKKDGALRCLQHRLCKVPHLLAQPTTQCTMKHS